MRKEREDTNDMVSVLREALESGNGCGKLNERTASLRPKEPAPNADAGEREREWSKLLSANCNVFCSARNYSSICYVFLCATKCKAKCVYTVEMKDQVWSYK